MNKTELTEWAVDVFWSAYTGLTKTPHPTRYTAGARGEAVKKILTINPPADLRKELIDSIAAQMLHRRKLYEQCGSAKAYQKETDKIKFYCNRNGATWLNQNGWLDEIPSLINDYKTYEETEQKCITANCNNGAIGGNIKVCQACECKTHAVYREKKRDYLRRVGLVMAKGETLHDYAMRCKEHTFGINLNLTSPDSTRPE